MPPSNRRRQAKPSMATQTKRRSGFGKGKRLVKSKLFKKYAPKTYKKLHTHVAKSGLITVSNFNLAKRKTTQIRELEYNGTPNIYTVQNFGNYYCAGGQQKIFSYANMVSDDLFFIRTLTPAGSSGNEVGARWVLDSYLSELSLSNTSNASVELSIYEITLKRDILKSLVYDPTGGSSSAVYTIAPNGGAGGSQTQTSTLPPEQYWYYGSLINNNIAPTSSILPNYPSFLGASPYDSQLFRDYFNVKSKKTILLQQGGSHRHFTTIRANEMMDDAFIVTNQSIIGMKGFTTYTMVVAKGFPCTTGIVEDNDIATTTPIQISAVQTRRYKYTWVQDQTNNNFTQQQLSTPPNPPIVNIGNGQIEAWSATV